MTDPAGALRSPSAAVPTLPAVVARIIALYGREDYSTNELVQLLETDPGISSRLLRLANSAYYGLRRQVSTLETAVLLLGRVSVQAVALAAAILRRWEGRPIPPRAQELWVHAYLAGTGCRYLARRLPRKPSRSPPDALFLTGLLHDLGKLLFLAEAPEEYLEDLDAAPSREALLARERERFGRDHAETAGETLDAWQLPLPAAAVVRYHHRGGIRDELRADWNVLTTVNDLLRGITPDLSEKEIPEALLNDLGSCLEGAREEALSFYRAIAR